ncbi:MAG: S-layer homology domain-containing protein [Clostridia bacterium]|nr:S-layer homology domain-containing protein [Clostridia bacterium]
MKRIFSLFLTVLITATTIICTYTPVSADSAYLPFTDVVRGGWYESSLIYCYEHGYMKGTSQNLFSPGSTLTRAMTVQILYSINNINAVQSANDFTDVTQSQWFYPAVEWAYENGIASGTGNGRFSPQHNVTRQDFFVMLYNYSKIYSHYDTDKINDNYLYFDDNDSIADYATNAMNWAAYHGFLSGYADNTLRPAANMTRAEITSVIKRFDDTLGHRWVLKSKTPVSCVNDGSYLYACNDCSATKKVSLTGGHFRYLFAEVKGTCQTKGYLEYRCKFCNVIKSEPTSYGEHSFTHTSTVKATRTKGGYSVYTCSYCKGTNHRDYTPALGRTEGWDSNYDGKLTIDEYFGAYGIVDFLTEHKYDYVGTPYVGLHTYINQPWMLIRDKGLYPYSAGMNCTGFVASVINRCGGNLGRVANVGKGSYANAYNWHITVNRNNIFHYTFPTASAALKSGLLKKGDIFIFMPEAYDSNPNDGLDPDYHLGIFWGDYPSHDVYWHSTGATRYNYNYGVRGLKNQITRISSGTPYSSIWVFPLSPEN